MCVCVRERERERESVFFKTKARITDSNTTDISRKILTIAILHYSIIEIYQF